MPAADVLSRFESDLAYLAATDLHPALRISASAVSGSTAGAGSAASSAASGSSGAASQQAMQPAMASLLHLLNAGALRESAAGAARGHTHFGSKVSELEGLFGALKADVEALFMQVSLHGPHAVVGTCAVLGAEAGQGCVCGARGRGVGAVWRDRRTPCLPRCGCGAALAYGSILTPAMPLLC